MFGSEQLVVVTGLDGTLLDAQSYSADVAKPCVARCIAAGVPVVACSSKTLGEQMPLHKELGLDGQPFVVENGSAIIAPQGYFTMTHIGQALLNCGLKVQVSTIQRSDLALTYEAVVLGVLSAEIRKVLNELKDTCSCLKGLRTFQDLSIPELAELSGLSHSAAERAQCRDYSQTICSPLDAPQKEALHRELRKHGMTFSCGGRFHTVTAYGMDKGNAVTLLRSLLEVKFGSAAIVGLGNAENDRTMLQAVDRAFLVRRPDGSHCEAADPLKSCMRVEGLGPWGWVEAVTGVLDRSGDKPLAWGTSGAALGTPKANGGMPSIPECWPCDSGVYDAKDFLKDLEPLRRRKRELGVTVSFIFPTLDEEETIGAILQVVNGIREGLLDEVIVVDGGSQDRTREIAEANGARVVVATEVLPEWRQRGKGIQLWKSLLSSTGDICCWCDSDTTNFSELFVVGLVGPLLVDPGCRYVKAFYKRPVHADDGQASCGTGGRVTELLARPFVNLQYPELRDVIQPLSGEFGGWRRDLERLSFTAQYGVETKLLLEFSRVFGAGSIRQVNLHERRRRRHRSLPALSETSFLILQTFFADMAERLHCPDMARGMQSSTRIVREQAASSEEQRSEGAVASSLQDVAAMEVPLPPVVMQPAYLEAFYPGLAPSCVVLVAVHEARNPASKAVRDAARSLGRGMESAQMSVAKVVADLASSSGLPLRVAAELINMLPDGEVRPQLDVLPLGRPGAEDYGSTRASDVDSDAESNVQSPAARQAQSLLVELLAGLAHHKCAGDFERDKTTSVIVADSDTIKILYRMVYNVDRVKAFEDAEGGGQVCTAWRLDFLHKSARGHAADRCGQKSTCSQSAASASTVSLPFTVERLKAHGSDTALGIQMRQLPLWRSSE